MNDQGLGMILGAVVLIGGLSWWLFTYCKKRFNYGMLDWVIGCGIFFVSMVIICLFPVLATFLGNIHYQLWMIGLGILAAGIVLALNIQKTDVLFGILVTIAQLGSFLIGLILYLVVSMLTNKRAEY